MTTIDLEPGTAAHLEALAQRAAWAGIPGVSMAVVRRSDRARRARRRHRATTLGVHAR